MDFSKGSSATRHRRIVRSRRALATLTQETNHIGLFIACEQECAQVLSVKCEVTTVTQITGNWAGDAYS